jgi:hypothetical protein
MLKLPELTYEESGEIAMAAKPHLDAVFSMLDSSAAFDVAAIGILLRQASAALHKGLRIGQLVPDRDTRIDRDGVTIDMCHALGQVGAVAKLAASIKVGDNKVEDMDGLQESMVKYLASAMFDIDQMLCHTTFRLPYGVSGVYYDPKAE